MKYNECVSFLQWALPRLGLRWAGCRRVRGQVCKRIARRLKVLGLDELGDYRGVLEENPDEWDRLDGLCRISISRFYRDRAVWRILEKEIVPRLTAQDRTRRLRIWSAGCASGEESYTLAQLFVFDESPAVRAPEILATDADPHLLERARHACYPASSLRDLPETWRTAFERTGDAFCLKAQHRASVRFLEQDIRRSMPTGLFDLILCRNLVFTYFETPLQQEIAGRLTELLAPGGFLLVGTHESLPEPVAGFVQERPWLYRRRTEEGRAHHARCHRG